MSRRKDINHEDESTDNTDEKNGHLTQLYPFALVLRMRVVQVVCGISTLLMGAVAMIEEKTEFNMSIGIPAGVSTVIAAASSIYSSRGFDGYQPSSCSPQSPWARLRFLGPTLKRAGTQIILWGTASALLCILAFRAVRTLMLDMDVSPTISILAGIDFLLCITVIVAIVAIARIDFLYDPD